MSRGTSAFVRNIAAWFTRCRILISTVSIWTNSLTLHNLPLDFTSASNSRSAANVRQAARRRITFNREGDTDGETDDPDAGGNRNFHWRTWRPEVPPDPRSDGPGCRVPTTA